MIAVTLSACEKFLDIEAPKDSIIESEIFKSDDVATSALTGIYSKMALSGYASGGNTSISISCGLAADELTGYNATRDFYENEIPTANTTIATSMWQGLYHSIYTSNAIMEGMTASNGLTPSVKRQLEGEALFVRAFANFYLVNLFGSVPLNLTTDHRINQTTYRKPVKEVYDQIIIDLSKAEGLLEENYITIERIRPNKSAAQALLARVYLYLKDWENAEMYASLVIAKTSSYQLLDLDQIFLKNSQEAIWQLMPTVGGNTSDGNILILTATPTTASLNADFALNAFEMGDKRKGAWVKIYTNTTGTYYYPFKYKVKSSINITEYSMVMRLAEQYLIRAEARAHQNKLANSIEDVDKIRARAGLSLIKDVNPTIGQTDLLDVIQNERRIELFSEWGHRWFDLKRTGKINQVLSTVKPKWQATDASFPIPKTEIDRNPNITQNDGY